MGRMKLRNIPGPLRPFVPVIERWIDLDGAPLERLREAETDEAALAELQALSRSWSREQQEAFAEWSEGGVPSAFEWNAFHHFLVFLDALGICPGPGSSDRVQEYIDDLAQFGSPMKDSRRMWAVRMLPAYGPAAMRAIPLLKDAIADPDPRVQIWAHYALALLDGDMERHRRAIQSLGRQHRGGGECVRLDAREALQSLSRTPRQHALEAICGFCITGDLENIKRLLPQTDINQPDHDGAYALQMAVGNQKVEVVEWLLAQGARADVRDQHGDTLLHKAAPHRLGGSMIELLVRHGADVNARNEKGQTPLDRALEFDRTANAELLRRLGGVESRLGEVS
jgi:hypothetical protein